MGNLARSDAHCLSLVQEHGLAPFLASLLSQADDIKVAHGLVSLLKNLSIPVPNKTVIGQLDVISAVVRFMGRDKDMVQPLQFATVGLLKHLCAGVTENAVRLVDGDAGHPSALNALVDMIQRIDDVPTKMEATRVLVNAVKSLWTSARSSGAAQPLSEDAILAARRKAVRRDVIQALAEMVRTSQKYPVLVNEGIIALTLVGSERMGAELVSMSLLSEPAKAAQRTTRTRKWDPTARQKRCVHLDADPPWTAPLRLHRIRFHHPHVHWTWSTSSLPDEMHECHRNLPATLAPSC